MRFHSDFCLLQDLHNGKVRGTGRVMDGLYYWDHIPNRKVQCFVTLNEVTDGDYGTNVWVMFHIRYYNRWIL